MENIEQSLTGKQPNSLEITVAVVEYVIAYPAKFDVNRLAKDSHKSISTKAQKPIVILNL